MMKKIKMKQMLIIIISVIPITLSIKNRNNSYYVSLELGKLYQPSA